MTDARDPHDDGVDAAWRAQVRDAPPAALDQAILATAHRAVQSAPRAAATPSRWRAFAPLAVAATLGAIALGVLQLAPREDTSERVTGDAPVASLRKSVKPQPAAPTPPTSPASAVAQAPAAAAGSVASGSSPQAPAAPAAARSAARSSTAAPPAAQPVTPSSSTAQRSARALLPSDAPRAGAQRDAAPRREQEAVDARARAAPDNAAQAMKDERVRPEPFPAAPPMTRPTEPPREAQARAEAPTSNRPIEAAAPAFHGNAADALASAPRNDVAGAPAPASPAAAAPAARAKVASARPPDEFIADIRRLRDEGQDAAAVRTLVAFRAAYADADERLPQDLRAWARGVR